MRSAAVLALLLLTGCAAKHHVQTVDITVRKECVLADPILKDCDADQIDTTPHCRAIVLKFKAGCETVLVKAK